MKGREEGRGHRGDLPRRLGEIITPALDRLAGGDEARAYSAWARAVGGPVAGGTRPKGFRRGQLTVECASSVWANELTYLGPQILRRMDEVAPGHPVERFRFVVGRMTAGRGPVPDAQDEQPIGSNHMGEAVAPAGAPQQPPPGAEEGREDETPSRRAQEAARAETEGVGDLRLREAIKAVLRRSSEECRETPGGSTPSG